MIRKFSALVVFFIAAAAVCFGQSLSVPSVAEPENLARINGKKSPLSTTGAGVDFTINLVYEDDAYQAKTFYIYNEDTFLGGSVSRYDLEGHTVALEGLIPGKYTVMAAFQETTSHPGNAWTWCYVFLEEVDVTASGSVDVVATDAKNQFMGKSYLPDGEVARLDNNGYDENFDPKFVEGNCRSKIIQNTIFDTKYNAWIVNSIGSTGTYEMDNIYGLGIHWRPEEMYNFMVNDISDRFVICQQRANYLDSGIAATAAFSYGIENLTLENDLSNYRSVEEFFTHTPAFYKYGSPDEKNQFSCLDYGDWTDLAYRMMPWKVDNDMPYTIFYSTSSNRSSFPEAQPYYRFQLYDAAIDWDEFYLNGQRFGFDDDGVVYVFSNFYDPSEVSGTRALDENGDEVWYDYPGNAGLEVAGSPFLKYSYGNSCSVNTINPVVYNYHGAFVTNFNPSFKGLLGEDRQADKIGLEVSAYHNGEKMEVDGELWNSFWNTVPLEDVTGVYSAVISNNTNIQVDEIEGISTTTLSFSYEKEDACPPALQAVQFRTADNAFAQYFGGVEDVEIVVCAGDYDWVDSGDYLDYNYYSKPVSLKVEVAPHSDNERNWTDVPMQNIEEYNNQAAYGYYFRGALKEVEANLPEGWYDLHVTVTDEAGNTNDQIFGPAFFVDKGAGCESVEMRESELLYTDSKVAFTDGAAALFRVYSSDGGLILQTYATSVSLADFTDGLYMVVATRDDKNFSLKAIK